MTPLKQCDPRWGSKKLGTGNICDRGCVVTACAMLAGTTPDKIVDEANFTTGGAILWQSLKSIKFIWRGYSYDNAKVLQAIKDYGGCLVEVSMPQAPGGKHWVLFIGDGKMNDPLTGKTENTSKYTPTGYCILEPIKQGEPMPDKCPQQRDEWWTNLNRLVKAITSKGLENDEFEQVKAQTDQSISKYEKAKEDSIKYKKQVDTITANLNEKIGELESEVKAIEKSLAGQKGEVTKKENRIQELEEINLELKKRLINQPTIDMSSKILELVGYYLIPTAGLTYLSIYLTRVDSEAAIAIAPTINLIIYILKQEAEKLMLKLGVKRLEKGDK
jgi:hypothetical protein